MDELAHLDVLLNKQPIIGTWTAQDLVERPAMVRDNYLGHVRSFVVLGRLQVSSTDEQMSVGEYEKRVIRLVKEKGAAKGYITADFGYGKTSTALFLWQRCEAAEIVAVPPFQIQKLTHLLTATYGWVRFKLTGSYPQLAEEAEAIYLRYINRGIEAEAQTENERELLRRTYAEGRYTPELQALDYVKFFGEMADLVLKAGYSGLVILADELQQYIEPDIKAGLRDPLAPLFNIIQVLLTRKGQLPFALLLSVPRKELGLMNDQRGDLVQRLKDDKLALDLGAIYNQTFARDLWEQLARELAFETLKDKIVAVETLEALGQISARADLATGPRTVVDVFKLMTRRYLEHARAGEPFSPLDLVNAFLSGEVSQDNLGKFQTQINKHLAHQFVRDIPDLQRAIKCMAAFPIDGLPESYFERYHVRKAIDELTRLSRGDIVTFAGGGYDDQGRARPTRALLVGLEETEVKSDWLTTTIREFISNYVETSQRTRNLMLRGFQYLLRQEVFKSDTWKLLRSLDPTFTQPRMYVFEGAFPNTTRRSYPDRVLEVRVRGAWEQVQETPVDEGDLALCFVLDLHHDVPEEPRRAVSGTVHALAEKMTAVALNMSHNSGQEQYDDLHQTLDRMVAPWKITPALLLSLYAYLEEKREAGVIPKGDDQTISTLFQPALLEHAFNELFNAELGTQMDGAGATPSGIRIIEEVVKRDLLKYYGQYQTLMTNSRWKESLRRYHTALEHLPTPFVRQGQHLYISSFQEPISSTKSKQDLASVFTVTVPAVENFLATNPLLIKAEGEGWRFLLHPLEEQIMAQLRASPITEAPRVRGGKPRAVLAREAAWKLARHMGYREEEFDAAVELLEKRGLVSVSANRGKIVEEETRVPQIADLRALFTDYQGRLQRVKVALPGHPQVAGWLQELPPFDQAIERCAASPDEQLQTRLAETLRTRQRDLDGVIQTQQQQINQHTSGLIQQAQMTFKQRGREVLQQPPGRGLFGHQLETQRQSLLKVTQKVEEEFAPLREQASEIQALVAQPGISPDDLVRLAQTAEHFQKALLDQQRQMTLLQEMVGYYDQAYHLLRLAQEFQESRLHQAPADLAAASQAQLEAWSLHISGELSGLKLEGLRHAAVWRQEFESLRSAFEQQVQAERERFVSTQEDYRRFLMREYPHARMWTEVVFNPAEPQDSYMRLWDGVHEVLKQVVELARKDVLALFDRAARLQGGGLATLPPQERPAAQTQLNEIQDRLHQQADRATQWVEQVLADNFMHPVRERGMTTPAEEMLKPIVQRMTKFKEQLTPDEGRLLGLEQQVLKAKLSSEEEAVLAELTHLHQNKGAAGELELGLLLQGAADQQARWRVLTSLYTKQRLRITIAPILFEE